MKRLCLLLFLSTALGGAQAQPVEKHALVLLSDFGLTGHFVASMKGVALSVDPGLQISDLTHNVEPFDIWQASYHLTSTIEYWPKGTVFVAVVDPGVGTKRKSIVLQTATGHFVVTPDNGTLTLAADQHGVAAVREIDESTNRRPGSEESHTFHGRDVYVYAGARLASGIIDFSEVGPILNQKFVKLRYQKPEKSGDTTITGNITNIEAPFGNIVTNISKAMVDEWGLSPGIDTTIYVEVLKSNTVIFSRPLPYVPSFGYVDDDEPLLYVDSAGLMGLAINNGNFGETFNLYAGTGWSVRLSTQ